MIYLWAVLFAQQKMGRKINFYIYIYVYIYICIYIYIEREREETDQISIAAALPKNYRRNLGDGRKVPTIN
jgi:hypothetical protein